MNFQNLLATLHVRKIDVHLPVKTPGPQKGWIQNIFSVRRRNDDNSFCGIDPVHLDEQRIQGLFPFIMSPAQPMSAAPSHRINFVDENQARRRLFPLLKHVPHPGGSHSNEHFHKIRSADSVEGNIRLTGNRLGQKGFSCSGRSHHQNPLGDPSAQFLELFGVPQKLHNLTHLILRLLHAGHIGKGHLIFVLRKDTGLALAETEGRFSSHPDLLTEEKVHDQNKKNEGQRPGQRLPS